MTNLYYELMEDNTGFAFIAGEPEYFRSLVELHHIGSEFYPDGYTLYQVTADNWQQLYDQGVFDNEEK
ncbi:hypothetical protein [Photobacterium angustum]|uniref:hypothetical protein n=2 Tax=Photobacterium TaxID=657 RepID=UPI0005DF8B9A|nr:hypothetical protein [Photobacterium angustum]KJF95124.1 hypothetical protein UB39_07075 [Photobacterium angustum]PSW81193.1 hypothetical protein CTN03_08780 [Photobacterium angustum]